jgi:Tol biopolymer transport system component/DNA-binding winged helix-turn-helix (wHTH) protein
MYRFGSFQLDPREHELRRGGLRIKIQEQSFTALLKLLERPGQLVSRDDLRNAIWKADTFVDFDIGLNKVIKQLREVLGDPAESPIFIQTAPKLGYRFIAPVEFFEKQCSPEVTSRSPYLPAAIGLIVIILGSLALWITVHGAPRAPRVLRFTRLTNDGQAKPGPMVTDGSRIYFNESLPGLRSLIVQVSTKGGEPVALSLSLKHPEVLDLSKDGTQLLVANADEPPFNFLWEQPVEGGSPRRVGTILAESARFSADGNSIIYSKGGAVYSVSRDGSSISKLLTTNSSAFSFQFSPNARTFRFTQSDRQLGSNMIMEAAANGTGLHKMFSGSRGKWTLGGRLFVFEKQRDDGTDLWVVSKQSSFPWRKRDDQPIQLTAGPLNFEHPLPSKDGKEVFAIGGSHRAEVIRYDAHSGQFVPYLSGISAEGLAFSQDGKWVAYTSYPEGTLWRSKMDGSERLQLTFPPLRVLLPRWSPDGKQMTFFARVPGANWNIYLVSGDGGTPQKILPSEQSQVDPNWSPDGNSLLFSSMLVRHAPLYVFDLASQRISELPGSRGLFSPRWSPDGRYIVALTSEQPWKMMLFDSASQKWAEVFDGEVGYLWWSRQGEYIYFQDKGYSAQGGHNRIVRFRLSDRRIESIIDVKNVGRSTTGTIVDWFGLAPDDSPLFARDISTAEIYSLEIE